MPVVPAWGPPSVPNTPVIGRHVRATTPSQASQRSSTPPMKPHSPITQPDVPHTFTTHPNTLHAHITDTQTPTKRPLVDSRKTPSSATQLVVKGEVHHSEESMRQTQGHTRLLQEVPGKGRPVGGVDSGFSTPCTRTPSPNMDTVITSAK